MNATARRRCPACLNGQIGARTPDLRPDGDLPVTGLARVATVELAGDNAEATAWRASAVHNK
jgi:hypothetical protein